MYPGTAVRMAVSETGIHWLMVPVKKPDAYEVGVTADTFSAGGPTEPKWNVNVTPPRTKKPPWLILPEHVRH